MPQLQAAAIPSPMRAAGSLELLPLDRLDEAVLGAAERMRQLQAALGEQARRAEALEQQALDLERQLAVAEARLAVEMMHSAGLTAQASHMLALGIESDVLSPSELAQYGNDTSPKSRLTEVYEAAFDAKGAELGIDEPARFREA
ncbi:hypothetical protein J8J14_09965 [Roseomonas sp. SSH11]|uniref:Uncharacterized protein n=1 Tax=Pararoseomonas baculiformis TaxID=2820812 RepID=A0ABS4AE02_9PROT|nr:hypothetical protein [Pararoseomonas baculiformis]MBP0445106.1 hypothetical protein [Pararoseomonas baculiformis]